MTIAQQLEQIFHVPFSKKENLTELRQFHDNNAFCCDEKGKVIGVCACENDFDRLVLPNSPVLHHLQYLNLSDNSSLQILAIETSFSHLQHLDISDCKIKQIRLLDGYNALNWLDVSRNKLEHFILEGELRDLEYLDLSGNQLADFKTHLLYKFPSLKGLYLKNNPLHESKRTSVDKVGNCLSFLWSFQQELELGTEENKEYKVILVGNGGVGKTCLVERLVYNTFRKKHFSTHGVSLEKYEQEDFPFILNLWDFAGQDIYHATHRLFMQANAIYLLLWDEETRKADTSQIKERGEFISYENHDLYYWLDYIRPNEGKSSVIIVKTKSSNDRTAHPDQAALDSIFKDPSAMSLDWHQIDSGLKAWKENGFERLLGLLKMNIELMTRDEQIPRSWANLRTHMRQLLQQEVKTISLQEYEDIAADYGVKNSLNVLINWLVPTGVVFYRENYFEDAVIIDQSWAMEAIYIIFNRNAGYYDEIGKKKGRFTGKDLSRFWQEQKKDYSTAEKELLLNFMLGCELCFEIEKQEEENHRHIPFEERTFISPQLLPSEIPKAVDVFKRYNPQRLYVQYRSRSLHYGLIQSFIVKTQYLAKLEGIWKYGILLHEENTNALVKGHSNRIEVEVPGAGLVMLDKIRNLIDDFPRKDLEEWVSVDGENFVQLKELQGWKHETIQADSGVPIPTTDLQVFLKRNTQNTFDLPKPKRSNAPLIEEIEKEQLQEATLKKATAPPVSTLNQSALKFLFLAASPQNISAISWEKERSAIERKLNDRIERNECNLKVRDQVSQDDMWESISDFQPQLIHFSGHGEPKWIQPDGSINDNHGLALHQDEGAGVHYLQPTVLKEQFKIIKELDLIPALDLVFLNACYSDEAAKAISCNQIYTIGTKTEVISEAAQHFSASFYRSYLKQQNLVHALKTAKLTGARFDKDTLNAYVLYFNGEEITF